MESAAFARESAAFAMESAPFARESAALALETAAHSRESAAIDGPVSALNPPRTPASYRRANWTRQGLCLYPRTSCERARCRRSKWEGTSVAGKSKRGEKK